MTPTSSASSKCSNRTTGEPARPSPPTETSGARASDGLDGPRPVDLSGDGATALLSAEPTTEPRQELGADLAKCSEWNALDVTRHIVAVIDRATVGAAGRSLDAMTELAAVDLTTVRAALAESTRTFRSAWADDGVLAAPLDVPWGTFPGAAVLAVYTADLLVHCWNLAAAIGIELNWPEADVLASLEMAKVGFPNDRREDMPFEPAVRTEPDATAIEQLAAWVGRDISAWPQDS